MHYLALKSVTPDYSQIIGSQKKVLKAANNPFVAWPIAFGASKFRTKI